MIEEGAGDPRHTDPRGLLVTALQGMGRAALPIVAALYGTGALAAGLIFAVPAILAVFLASIGLAWLAWHRRTYVTGAEDIRLEQGILSRSARTVPYERIQDVSLEQKLLPRLLGLAEVKFETGAGGKDELALAYLDLKESERLRELVRARKQGVGTLEAESGPVEDVPDRPPLFAMDEKRLLTFGLFEFSLVIFAVLFGAISQFDFLFPFDIWDWETWQEFLNGREEQIAGIGRATQLVSLTAAIVAVILLGVLTGIVRTFAREYGFRLDRTDKGFRRRRGLFNKTDVVLPAHRVQAARIETGLIRRRFGWHSLKFVSLAQDSSGSGDHPVAPFARWDELEPIAKEAGIALPARDQEWQRPAAGPWLAETIVLSTLFLGVAAVAGIAAQSLLPLAIAGVPIGATALANYIAWRRHRHAIDDRQLFVRQGTLAPKLAIAPQVKLQSVEIAQGPLARWRGYATLNLGLAGGTLSIPGLPLGKARALRSDIVEKIAAVDFSDLPR
ncbi:MAG TPA: PH domain-containing protein [Sphingomonadaceae bacterium]|nr:PH domain-containing protein [Sphingomonadaceae bacterium]